jgi:hypothetical protein
MATIDKLKQIVSEHQYQKIHGSIVDATTANMLVTVRNALSKKNQPNFDKMLETPQGFRKLVDFGWSHIA